MFVFLFFFQAEDGIRDGTVTGVQTCALPIYELPVGAHGTEVIQRRLARHPDAARIREDMLEGEPIFEQSPDEHPLASDARSEERRVGKECRSRWSRDHYKTTEERE